MKRRNRWNTIRSTTRLAKVAGFAASIALAACQGSEGPQGNAGVPGPQGAQGAAGAAGAAGASGPAGANGVDGAAGATGPEGPSGASGADGADGATGPIGATGPASAGRGLLAVSSNPAAGPALLQIATRDGEVLRAYQTGGNEGVFFDQRGVLYHAGDLNAAADPGSIRRVSNILDRSGPSVQFDVLNGGAGSAATTLENPKGIVVAQKLGWVIVADTGVSAGVGDGVKAFYTTAAGDLAPIATANVGGRPWDIVYDEPRDRLFAALTNGNVAVIDRYSLNVAAVAPTRTIIPTDPADPLTKISVNLHGIDYDARNDRLALSDVGSAAVNTDGQLFTIDNASTAEAETVVSRRINGPATLLGNPVDLLLDGPDLIVAEKANNAILVWHDWFVATASGDVAPGTTAVFTAPESFAFVPAPISVTDQTDRDETFAWSRIFTTRNSNSDVNNRLARFDASFTLGGEFDPSNSGVAVESAAFDFEGNGWVTFDAPTVSENTGGLMLLHRVSRGARINGGTFNAQRDELITGSNAGLTAPKGLEIVDELGLVIVCDVGTASVASRISVFSMHRFGDVAPLFTVALGTGSGTGTETPWDADYDLATDRLFVALQNGDVRVYRDFINNLGTNFVDVEVGGDNAHGIVYVAATDDLIVSDVNIAADTADGSIRVYRQFSSAVGVAVASTELVGASTTLGNPVDIAFDGQDLFVAEKANGLLQRWNNILNRGAAVGNIAPDFSAAAASIESVSLIANTLPR